jgi:hypothetical protein
MRSALNVKHRSRIAGYIDMQNAIIDDPSVTTGDHDGKAVVLCAADDAAADNR